MQPPALRAVLTINVVVYVLWLLLFIHIGATRQLFLEHLSLVPFVPDVFFEPWQFVTYNFLHLSTGFWGLIHILFNMLWLVWIGREYEEMHGSHRFLAIYLIAGVGGGLVTVLWYLIFPPAGMVTVFGASASVLGVITAVAIFYPYKSIALFLIPFPIRLIHLVIAFLVLDVLLMAGGTTAVSAHLGGALFGFLFARGERSGIDLSSWARVFFERGSGRRSGRSRRSKAQRSRGLFKSGKKRRSSPEPQQSARITRIGGASEVDESDSGSDDIDRILDKISEKGYEALTAEEKKTLYEASKR